MKAYHSIWIIGLVGSLYGLSLIQCTQQSGSLTPDAIQCALQSPTLSISTSAMTWLQEQHDVVRISSADRARVISYLNTGVPKQNPDGFYEDCDDANGERVFYLMTNNEQPLVMRVEKQRVCFEDLTLSKEVQSQLYAVLSPYFAYFAPVHATTP